MDPRPHSNAEEKEEVAEDGQKNEGKGEGSKRPRQWYTKHCRSFYPFVCRRFQGKGFGHWFAVVRKPQSLKSLQEDRKTREGLTQQEITQGKRLAVRRCLELHHQFETDIEAAVAGRVIALVYHKHLDWESLPGCLYLTELRMKRLGVRLPDPVNDDEVRAFAAGCADDFVEIAKDARYGRMLIPPGNIGISIRLYWNYAWPCDSPYKGDMVFMDKPRRPGFKRLVVRI